MPKPVDPEPPRANDSETAEEREQRTVHDVYESIAGHFSQTRYKPWPIVQRFLSSLPLNSIGLDSGCGNGKYLPVCRASSEGSWMIGLDRSLGLLEIAQKGGSGTADNDSPELEECVRGDLIFDGWRDGVFDFAISIAAIHHLSTPSRRQLSIQRLLRPLHLSSTGPHSRFLIYVWAYEQGANSKRKMGVLAETTRKEGHDSSGDGHDNEIEHKDTVTKEQDVMVPWVLQPKPEPKKPKEPKSKPKQQRRKKEGANPLDEALEAVKDLQITTSETVVIEPVTNADKAEPQVYHRYYHLFIKGELEDSVQQAALEEGFIVLPSGDKQSSDHHLVQQRKQGSQQKWFRIVETGYEKDNWWLEGEVGVFRD